MLRRTLYPHVSDERSLQCAMLRLALGFASWRALVQDAGLKQAGAVSILVRAIECAAEA